MNRLDEHFKEFAFFKKLEEETDHETLMSCFKIMQMKEMPKNEIVFKYGKRNMYYSEYIGDIGTLFYIILEGSVNLRVPTAYEAELSCEEIFLFMLENIKDIDWEALA